MIIYEMEKLEEEEEKEKEQLAYMLVICNHRQQIL